ncbi:MULTISPECIES: acyl-CoA dehydrogenase family protein [Roseobacteraceae]|uniref:Acyl-CoA dehydrogenase n=1 Tax=Pseudosulfitobacter pseudonitzschiae TaxID=1402135 RepID=A0A221K575_9RHOB|nr:MULTISPECIES: acyl-CoA dehydrogenase [Roseobacteraceae]ASM74139.1 acyl-CoA dehydrogenase [Pseudosulfitobacter pseudonitzschiae]
MRFAASEDEVMVEDMLDRALREARDKAPRIDGHALRPEPKALRAQLGSLGLWGAWLPEAAGGADGGPRLLMTLARGLGRVPTHHGLIGGCVLPGAIFARSGREDALHLATRLAGGEMPVAVAVMEPGTRWDFEVPTMRAEPDGDGYRLTGVKSHVAEGATAEVFLVSARDRAGVSLFLMPAAAKGLTVSPYPATDGTTWAMVQAERVSVPASARLIGPDDGIASLQQAFTLAAFAAAAEILGSCEAALTQTLEYLRTREQFGKPLATNQALQFRAADLHTDIEMLRSQVLGAANALSGGYSRRARSDVAAAMALATQTGDLVAREAIHLHGAIGMTRELGVGYHLLRTDVLSRWLGSAEHFRAKFLALEEHAA